MYVYIMFETEASREDLVGLGDMAGTVRFDRSEVYVLDMGEVCH